MKNNRAIAHWKLARVVGEMVLVVVCLTGTLASRDASASPTRRENHLVLGTIESIDRAASTITVRLSDGAEKSLQIAKRLTVNGREETKSRAESALAAQERAVIYYTDNDGGETCVEVESLNHAMRRTAIGKLVSADKGNRTVVLQTARGKEETFRVQNDAVIETGDTVMTFEQFEPQLGEQITLHYEDPLGAVKVSRIKH